MRVLILNQPFHPDVVATAQIAKDLADELVARGHDVTAIASRSIYGDRGAALPKREVVDGVRIRRVGVSRFGKGNAMGRVLDFASYYVGAAWMGLTSKRYDVVIALTTPPYIANVALLLKRLRGSRVVYWLMDVYPDVMIAHGMLRPGSGLHRALSGLHRRVLRRVDATVALGRCMKQRLVAQGADESGVHVVPVWGVTGRADTSPSPTADNPYRVEWNVGDRLLLLYSGNFGLAHDVQTFLDAADRLKDDDGVRFAFVGGGKRKAEVEAFVRERGLTNCIVADYQPRERLADLLSSADAHLVTMLPEWWGLVVPSKFFGVCAAARPALFVGPPESEIARCIEEWSCGAVVQPGDVDGLLASIETLRNDRAARTQMGERALSRSRAYASRDAAAARLCALVEGEHARKANREAVPALATEATP